jgi:isopentenyl-diphosphate Delta-isomerase
MHPERKRDHLKICLEENVEARGASTGLERYRLMHCALPEMALEDVQLSTQLYGKALAAPFLMSAMTGGAEIAEKVNKNLAAAAQKYGVAMGVGSQRAAIEEKRWEYTYQVRDVAPDILLFANLGAVQLNYGYGPQECKRAVEMIGADALVLHLNALQECLQPHGNTNFRGVLAKIGEVCQVLNVPVIVKEVGWGFSEEVAAKLRAVGVTGLDVAGAGGTSWSLVEGHRAKGNVARQIAEAFAGWGIPTALAIQLARKAAPDLPVIASGGFRSGAQAALAIALGADLVGIARPLLEAAMESAEATSEVMTFFVETCRIAMFSSGARDLAALRRAPMLRDDAVYRTSDL